MKLGVFGGWEQSNFSGEKPDEVDFEFKSGYNVGIRFDIPLTEQVDLSFQPGYLENGAIVVEEYEYQTPWFLPNPVFEQEYPVTTGFVNLPILAYIDMTTRFYALAGLNLSYLMFAEAEVDGVTHDIKEYLNEFQYGLLFGFGYAQPIKNTSLNFELSYGQGISRMTKDEAINGEEPPRLRTSRIRLTVFFMVPIGNRK